MACTESSFNRFEMRDSNQISESSGRTTRYMTSSHPLGTTEPHGDERFRDALGIVGMDEIDEASTHPVVRIDPGELLQAVADRGHDAAFVEQDHEVGGLFDQ